MAMRKKDILLLMATELGIADFDDDGAAQLPSDPENLRRLRAAFENGRITLHAEDPNFAFTRPELTITLDPTGANCIDQDPGRVALPYGVIAPPLETPQLEYPEGENGTGWPLTVTSMQRVRSIRSNAASATGAPTMAAFWRLESKAGDKSFRYEMRLDRAPDKAYRVTGTFEAECVALDDDDLEPSGYPLAVKAYGLWEYQRTNPVPTGPTQAAAAVDAARWLDRIKINERARRARNLGHSAKAVPNRRHGNSLRDPQWQNIPTYLQDGSRLS